MEQKAILIVDDIELNRAILCELFRESYEILEAEDGLSALHIIRERQEDLAVVLLDILMPVLDGFGVLETMRAEQIIERLPVIMITAENSENVALRGYELGVADIINKPFSPSVVHRRVENVISLYQYRFQLERIVDRQSETLARLSNAQRIQTAPEKSLDQTLPGNIPVKDGFISKRVLWLLEMEREKYRLLSEMSGDIVFSYDFQEDVIDFTENYQKVFGRETRYRQFLSHLNASEKIPPEDKELLLRKMYEKTQQEPNASVRIRIQTIRGQFEWFEIYLSALWNRETGQCAGFIGKIININDMKAEADHWREEAYRDPLTTLYNRKAVEELSSQLLLHPEDGRQAVLFFVDIDNFKQLNDQLGHLYGDEVLRYVGREMNRQFRASDIVGRIGGDEFVVLMDSIISKEDIIRKADDLCTIFRKAPCPAKLTHPISGSIGIACSPGDGEDYRDLLHKADMALYYAKSQGKNRYAFYADQP